MKNDTTFLPEKFRERVYWPIAAREPDNKPIRPSKLSAHTWEQKHYQSLFFLPLKFERFFQFLCLLIGVLLRCGLSSSNKVSNDKSERSKTKPKSSNTQMGCGDLFNLVR